MLLSFHSLHFSKSVRLYHNQLHKCNELNYANYGAALFNHLSIDSIVAFHSVNLVHMLEARAALTLFDPCT